jgi:hypothetical protein
MNRHQETGDRHVENLLRLMGERISELLAEEDVTDVNFNPPAARGEGRHSLGYQAR